MDSQEAVYLNFYNYNFADFKEYQEGLSQVFESYVFQHNQNLQPGQREISDISQVDNGIRQQLILQAQVFFFCEKTGDILSLDDYFEWKRDYESNHSRQITELQVEQLEPESDKNDSDAKQDQPDSTPYSSNYEKIVELICLGKPVPGIKQIPDKINEAQQSEHVLPVRKKPWEREDDLTSSVSVLDQINADKRDGTEKTEKKDGPAEQESTI